MSLTAAAGSYRSPTRRSLYSRRASGTRSASESRATKVQTWLNGEPMIEIEDELIGNTPGRIMLQIHDGNNIKVLWKNFKLTTL